MTYRRPLFVTSSYCASRANCNICRDRTRGTHWRDMMRMTHETPDGPTVTDFACTPLGLPWVAGTPSPCRCRNCGSESHRTKDCPIPLNYDGNYQLDSKGTAPCSC